MSIIIIEWAVHVKGGREAADKLAQVILKILDSKEIIYK